MARWNLIDLYNGVNWNRKVLGMRLSNWCMVTAGVATSAILLVRR